MNSLSVEKMLHFTVEMMCGADGPKTHATLQTALTQCVLKGVCSREEYVGKPLKGKQLKNHLKKLSVQQLNFVEEPYARLGKRKFSDKDESLNNSKKALFMNQLVCLIYFIWLEHA